jgi:hypothetical protein
METSARLSLVHGKGTHLVILSPKIVRALWGAPNLKNLSVGDMRDIYKTIQMANHSTDSHHTAQLFFWLIRPTSGKSLGFKKLETAERSIIEFLHICGHISTAHAC